MSFLCVSDLQLEFRGALFLFLSNVVIACIEPFMFVCYFVNNTSAVFNVKNTSAVCCKVSVWKSPRVIASCV